MNQKIKGCLWVIVAPILLISSCLIYKNQPHFNGRNPLLINVKIGRPDSTNFYEFTITNSIHCNAVLKELRKARFVAFGSKADGEFNIQYDNGKSNRIAVIFRDGDSYGLFIGAFTPFQKLL